MSKPSAIPSRKVGFGTLAGSVAAIAAFLYNDLTGHSLPPGIEAAFATIVTVLTAYLVPNSPVPTPVSVVELKPDPPKVVKIKPKKRGR